MMSVGNFLTHLLIQLAEKSAFVRVRVKYSVNRGIKALDALLFPSYGPHL